MRMMPDMSTFGSYKFQTSKQQSLSQGWLLTHKTHVLSVVQMDWYPFLEHQSQSVLWRYSDHTLQLRNN